MTTCTVTPADIVELERLNKLVALSAASAVRARNAVGGARAPRMIELWQKQAELLSFIQEHPTLIPVLAQRARTGASRKEGLLSLARECADWQVRGYPMAGSDVLNAMWRLGLLAEKELLGAITEAQDAFADDPRAMLAGG